MRHVIDKIRSETGQQIVFAALLMPLLIAFVGLVIDVGMAYGQYRKAQNAADAAASAAGMALYYRGMNGARTIAQSYASDNGFQYVTVDYPWQGPYASSASRNQYVQVQITSTLKPIFAGTFWNGSFPIVAWATAGYRSATLGSSFVVLNQTNTVGLEVAGSGKLNVTQGNFHVNATGSSAFYIHNGGIVVTQTPGTVNGGGSVTGGSNVTPAAVLNTGMVLADPYQDVPAPVIADFPVRANKATTVGWAGGTLYPGVYYGGVTINGGGRAILSGGVYIIAGGNLTVSNGATLTDNGNGVMIYFTTDSNGKYGTLAMSGGGVLSLTPMTRATSATYCGLTIFQDRSTAPTPTFGNGMTISGFSGVFYMPTAKLVLNGGSQTMQANFIVSTLAITNGAQLTVQGYRGDGWPTGVTDSQVE
jgi:Flp pilus assembly protein TadG